MMGYDDYMLTPEAIWFSRVPGTWRATKMREFFSERITKVSDKDYPPLSVGKMGVVPQLETAVKTDHGDNRKLIKKGDFAINSRSDRKGSGGMSEYEGSASLIITVLKSQKEINRKFCHYLLRSHYFSEEFYRNGHGLVSDLWTTRWDKMRNIYIPVPPRNEQDQIVRFLDWKVSEINKLISAKKRQIKILEETEKRIINDTVLHGFHKSCFKDSSNKWIGNIPSEWNIIKLGKFCSFQNGISESGEFFASGTPFVGYGDVYRHLELPEAVRGVAQSNAEQQEVFSVREGDIFFTRTSENIEEIGMAAVCKHTIEKAIFSGFIIRCRPYKPIINIDYMKYYLQIPAIRNHFSSMMNIVTRASLGQNLLKQMPVVVPPMSEQKEIAIYLDTQHAKYSDLINAILKEIENLNEFKTRLISDIVTGKIDVRGIEIPEYEYVEEEADEESGAENEEETDVLEEV